MKDAKEFLSVLFEKAIDRVCVVSYANDDRAKFPPKELYGLDGKAMLRFIKQYDVPGRAVYTCVSSVPSGKRKKENVGVTLAAFADLDFKGIAATRADIEAQIARLVLRPTFVIFTGNGIHLWWVFVEPMSDHARVERLLRRIADVLAGDVAVCEVSRVMRVPDTHNTKSGANHLVTILQRNDDRYTIEALEEYFNSIEPRLLRVVYGETEAPIKSAWERLGELNAEHIGSVGSSGERIDQDELWDNVFYDGGHGGGNVHNTIVKATSSLMSRGVPIDEVVQTVADEIWDRVPDAEGWDWQAEQAKIREACLTWMVKHQDVLEMQEDLPEWAAKNPQVKRAQKLAKAEGHRPGNGALNGSGKLNGAHLPAAGNNAPTGSAGDDDPLDVYAGSGAVPFPRGVLPKVIEDYAVGRGKLMGVDPNGLAMGALAACATVIPNSVKIQPNENDEDWQEATRLWVMHVGGVSAAKSAILDQPFVPVTKIDDELSHQNKIAMAEWLELPKDEQKGTKPPQPGIMVDDITVESLGELSQDSPDGTALKRDEGGGWFGSFEKYSGKKGGAADRSVWIRYYDGRRLKSRRIGRGIIEAEHFGGCVVLAIQPEVICKLAEGQVDDGLVQRFNPVILNKRTEGDDAALSAEARMFNDLIPELYNAPRQQANVVQFSPNARDVWKEMNREILKMADVFEVRNRQLSQHIVKYGTQYARMCLLFHCIEHPSDFMKRAVSADVCNRVKRWFWEFLFPHARHFYIELLSRSDNADSLLAIADYIISHNKTTIRVRDIQRGTGVMRNLEKKDVESVFANLHAWGWITPVKQVRADSVPYNVNPKVHDGRFAERALMVKRRNADYADAINWSKTQKLKQNEAAQRSHGSSVG